MSASTNRVERLAGVVAVPLDRLDPAARGRQPEDRRDVAPAGLVLQLGHARRAQAPPPPGSPRCGRSRRRPPPPGARSPPAPRARRRWRIRPVRTRSSRTASTIASGAGSARGAGSRAACPRSLGLRPVMRAAAARGRGGRPGRGLRRHPASRRHADARCAARRAWPTPRAAAPAARAAARPGCRPAAARAAPGAGAPGAPARGPSGQRAPRRGGSGSSTRPRRSSRPGCSSGARSGRRLARPAAIRAPAAPARVRRARSVPAGETRAMTSAGAEDGAGPRAAGAERTRRGALEIEISTSSAVVGVQRSSPPRRASCRDSHPRGRAPRCRPRCALPARSARRPPEALDRADPSAAAAGGAEATDVADREPARPRRAGDDRADAGEREGAIHRHAEEIAGPRGDLARGVGRDRRAGARRCPSRSGPTRRPAGSNAHRRSGQALARAPPRPARAHSGSTRSALVTTGMPRGYAELLEDGEMLLGLRHDALVGRDDQQREVDARRAGHHRPDEVLVARARPRRPRPPAAEIQRGEVEVDRDAPAPLLGQAVHRDAGQRGDQRRLAVVDVSGGADDHAATQGRRSQNSSAGSSAPSPRW